MPEKNSVRKGEGSKRKGQKQTEERRNLTKSTNDSKTKRNETPKKTYIPQIPKEIVTLKSIRCAPVVGLVKVQNKPSLNILKTKRNETKRRTKRKIMALGAK